MIDRIAAEKANFLPFRKRHLTIQQHQEKTDVEQGTLNGAGVTTTITTPTTNIHQNGHHVLKKEEVVSTDNNSHSTTTISSNGITTSTPSSMPHTIKPSSPQRQSSSPNHHVQNGKLKAEVTPGRPSHNTASTTTSTPVARNRPGPKPKGLAPKKKVVDDEEDDATDSSDDEEDDGKIYCVCRQPYNPNLWMIACDVCNDWYHGKCVQITATQARKIKVYVCPTCSQRTGKNIQYKTPKKRKLNETVTDSRSSSPNGSPRRDDTLNGNATDNETSSPSSPSPPPASDLRPMKRKKVVTDDDEKSKTVKCICPSKEEHGKMVNCDGCRCWLHLDCLRMSQAPDHFLCMNCKSKPTIAKSNRPREEWTAFLCNVGAMNNEGNTTDTPISNSDVQSEAILSTTTQSSGPYYPKKMNYYYQNKQVETNAASLISSQQNA